MKACLHVVGVCCCCSGQSADAAVRLQRHFGEHPAEPVGALRDRRRAGRRAHPARNKGKPKKRESPALLLLVCDIVFSISVLLFIYLWNLSCEATKRFASGSVDVFGRRSFGSNQIPTKTPAPASTLSTIACTYIRTTRQLIEKAFAFCQTNRLLRKQLCTYIHTCIMRFRCTSPGASSLDFYLHLSLYRSAMVPSMRKCQPTRRKAQSLSSKPETHLRRQQVVRKYTYGNLLTLYSKKPCCSVDGRRVLLSCS